MAIVFTWLRNYSTGDPIPSNQIKYSDDDNDLTSVKYMIDTKTSIDTVYPVGSIYMSVNSTDPGTLFGVGTWEQIQDRFLLSAGSTYTANATGGASTHTLTVEEMPSHNHLAGVQTASSEATGYGLASGSAGFTNRGIVVPASNASRDVSTSNRGAGEAFSTLPPYLVVYMWKRTS